MLTGEKVILDVISPSSVEWMRQQRNRPELRKYFREWKEISVDQQAKWYASRGNNTDPNHVYFEIRINPLYIPIRIPPTPNIHIAHDAPVGCTGLHYVDWRLRSAEFGVFISDEVRGQGIGKEALTMLFDYGFREMNLHKIWAEVYTNNSALKVYTNGLGMHVDGLLRHTQFSDGKYLDSTMLSILEDEWFDAHGGR